MVCKVYFNYINQLKIEGRQTVVAHNCLLVCKIHFITGPCRCILLFKLPPIDLKWEEYETIL